MLQLAKEVAKALLLPTSTGVVPGVAASTWTVTERTPPAASAEKLAEALAEAV